MSLKGKIFLSFSIVILLLLSKILYQVNNETEKLEISRITNELNSAQIQFLVRLEEQQNNISKLVETITLDQKFRSFLSMIKENFYSFTEEIANDSEGDIVFMVDDTPKLRGVFPQDKGTEKWLTDNIKHFAIEKILDSGSPYYEVLAIDGVLFSVIYSPLKESLKDDYAAGVIAVCKRIDNAWVQWLLGPSSSAYKFQIVFFVEDTLIASNVSLDKGSALLSEAIQNLGKSESLKVYEERFLAKHHLFPTKNKRSGFVIGSNLDEALEPFKSLEKRILIVGLLVFAIGILFTLFFSNRVVRPLRLLVAGVGEVEKGNFDFRVSFKSKDEVGQLSGAFNNMAQGLKEKEQMRNTFDKYVHPSIVTDILNNPEKLKLGGSREIQTVLFSDVANFTTFSEGMPPEDLILLLNDYLGAMTNEVIEHQGILDKYIGDAIMAFWGAPFCKGNHALLACQTAIKMQNKLEELRPIWKSQNKPEINARIGVSTGDMIVGNLGSEHARDYTCIGDTVNYGARLEGLNKYYGTKIIVDNYTRIQAAGGIEVRELDTVVVKGRSKGSPIFELIGEQGDITEERREMNVLYEEALRKYRGGEFSNADEKFKKLLEKFPDDMPSQVLQERCVFYIMHPPEAWTGVHEMDQK
jgi:class 3 adenylate cyclase